MPDINLIHDTGAGDQGRNDQEKQKRKQPRPISYTSPDRTRAAPKDSKPRFSLRDMLRLLRRGEGSPKREQRARILHEEKLPPISTPKVRPTPPLPTPPPVQRVVPAGPASRRSPALVPPSRNIPGVNLVPEDLLASSAGQNRLVMLGFLALITVLLVGATYIILALFLDKMKAEAKTNTDEVQQMQRDLRDLKDQEKVAENLHTLTLQAQQLLTTHVYWTKFFVGLEKFTVDSVYYRSMTADRAGRLTLAATGKDFRSVARQLVAFQQASDFIKTVSITSAAVRSAGTAQVVDFTATITLVDTAFYRDASVAPDFTITPAQ